MRALIFSSILAFLNIPTATSVQAQEVDLTMPQPERYYLACSVPSNRAKDEFRYAREAAAQLTRRQLQDPWAVIRDHVSKRKLPENCRNAVIPKLTVVYYDVECAHDGENQLVILREFDQGNGFFQVIIIADTFWIAGSPPICKRRR